MISEEQIDNVMWQCIRMAEENQTPFGAAIINQEGRILSIASNTTKVDGVIAHAEINAIKELVNYPGQDHVFMISTVEPCPMCAGAAVWAGIHSIYFGASISDASKYYKQIDLSCSTITDASWINITVSPGHLRNDCLQLLEKMND